MKYALINGVILDGNQDMEPVTGKVILVEGEKITAIVSKDSDISGYEKIDLGGKYIMPGLINMHIHLPATGKPKKKESDPKKLVQLFTSNQLMRRILRIVCQKTAQMQLYSGVTTVRTVGGVENTDSLIRDENHRTPDSCSECGGVSSGRSHGRFPGIYRTECGGGKGAGS